MVCSYFAFYDGSRGTRALQVRVLGCAWLCLACLVCLACLAVLWVM